MTLSKMQPSTVLGIGAAVAGVATPIAAAVASAITGDGHWIALSGLAAGAVAGGVTAVVLPDNSAEKGAVEKFMQDAVTAGLQKNLAGALPTLLADGLAVVNAAKAAAPASAAPAASAVTPAPTAAQPAA